MLAPPGAMHNRLRAWLGRVGRGAGEEGGESSVSGRGSGRGWGGATTVALHVGKRRLARAASARDAASNGGDGGSGSSGGGGSGGASLHRAESVRQLQARAVDRPDASAASVHGNFFRAVGKRNKKARLQVYCALGQ